uniref:S-locus cysteine-rich protein 6 n=1 Tax=Arabidopsis lyrata TaxID=59689 RepID=C7FE08_ARALY|nr:S-locus cysteine-rich protein 6 [Arabidopsis lyrata]
MKSATLFMVAYVFMLIFLCRHVKDLEAANFNCMWAGKFYGPCPLRNAGLSCAAEFSKRKSKEKPFNCYCANQGKWRVCRCLFC